MRSRIFRSNDVESSAVQPLQTASRAILSTRIASQEHSSKISPADVPDALMMIPILILIGHLLSGSLKLA